MKIKKKLLFLFMVASLICMLAICVSASTIYRDEGGNQLFTYEKGSDNVITSYSGAFPKVDGEGNAIIWYVSSSVTENGNRVHTVKSFKAIGDNGDVYGTLNENGYYSVSGISGSAIVSLNLPDNSGIKIIDIYFGGGYTSSFPIGSNILFAYLPNTLEEYSANPGGGGWTAGRIFQYTPILECYFSDLNTSNPNHMKGIGNFDFYGCRNLRKCILPNGLETIYGNDSKDNGPAFRECWSLTELVIPNTVTGIGAKAFEDCRSLVTIRLGEKSNVSSGNCLFTSTNNLKYVYISDSFVSAYVYVFSNGAEDMVFFYTGDVNEYTSLHTALSERAGNAKFTNAEPILWDSSKDDQYYKNLATSNSKCYVVYGYSPCLAFYGGHSAKAEGDSVVCERCGETIYCLNTEHNHKVEISYENYYSSGIKTVKCLDCNSSPVITEAPALFVCLGYSAPDDGRSGIAVGYTVNNDAIEEYEKASGKDINYGVFAVRQDKLGDSPVFGEDGNASKGVVSTDITSYRFSSFDLRIVNFKESQKGIKLAMGAYVTTTKDGVTVYDYLQAGAISENESYHFVSYNQVIDLIPDEVIEFENVTIKLDEEITLPKTVMVNGIEKEISYSFEGNGISIDENNVLKGLIKGSETKVTISGYKVKGEFTVKVESEIYKYVVVIGVDGAGTFFKDANTPNIDAIFANGALTYDCLTANPTISAQCWGSLLHGVVPSAHGLTNSIVANTPYPVDSQYPSFFRVIRENNENAVLASFCNWNPINVGIIENNIGVNKGTAGTDALLTENILAYLEGNTPTAMFVQFDEADSAGHNSNYGSAYQLSVISKIDGYIGQIYEAYKNKGMLDETLFIVTSDHGGTGNSHGGLADSEKYVMFAASGKTVVNGKIGEMEIRDTAAIVLKSLGYEAPKTWTARVPSNLFEGVTAGERPGSGSSDEVSDRYHETVATPEKESNGYITNYIKETEHKLNTYLTFDGNINDSCGGTTTQGGNLYYVEDGYFGKGVAVDDGYVSINNFKPGTNNFTISLWINSKTIYSDPCVISNKNWNSGNNLGFALTIRSGKVDFNFGNGGSNIVCTAKLPTDYTEGWMHIVAIVDRDNGKIGISVDFGTIVTVNIPDDWKTLSMDTNYVTNIGQDGTGKYGVKLPATVDEVMIFDGALDQSDVNALKEYYGLIETGEKEGQ